MTEVELINKNLKKLHGTDFTDRPIFRVVWAPSQTEKRVGEFNEFYGSIFVRTSFGMHERKKYPWVGERWVLEKLVTARVDWLPESANGHYEPIWVFEDSEKNYLAPKWFAIEFLLNQLMNKTILTPGDMRRDDEDKFQKEIEYFEDVISEHTSPLMSALHAREAVVVP